MKSPVFYNPRVTRWQPRHTGYRCLHLCTVPDLNEELDKLHACVVAAVADRLAAGDPSNDDIRTALQLLKQNQITAQLDKDQAAELKSKMASKLDFSALQGKVVPIKGGESKHRA